MGHHRVMATRRDPPPPPPGRKRLEDLSRGLLIMLNRVPRPLIVIGMAALLLAGMALEGTTGALCLMVLGLFLTWLIVLSWPVLPNSSRAIRVVVLALVFGAAWLKLSGRA